MVVPVIALALATAAFQGHPCRAALPRGPAVPAPVVLWTSCGGFRLASDGRVSPLPRHWLARHGGGTGRRYGADLAIRRTRAGRVILFRRGRVVWRSHHLYPNDSASVAFGPQRFAFAAYRQGVFLTDLRGPERLVAAGRGLYPFDFTREGQLLVTGGGAVTVVAPDGGMVGRFRYRQRNGLAFDVRTDTLFFVTPTGTLAAAHAARLSLVRRLRGIDGWISFAQPDLLVFSAARGVTVTRRDGTLVARARWPGSLGGSDSGLSVSADGRSFAFRVSDARAGARSARATVYVLRAGERRARVLYRHRLGPTGCGVGVNLRWLGRFLLYSSTNGQPTILDSGGGSARSLGRVAALLPRRAPGERASAAWASEFR